VLGVSRAWLAAYRDDIPPEPAAAQFDVLIARRLGGQPIAYLIGRREFYGHEFRVTPDVLIPRPETELLVEAALEILPQFVDRTVLDLGTGSGCISIAIARERPTVRVTAVDRSTAALAVARFNAGALGATVEFIESDWFAGLAGRSFDLIISNPPYVASDDPHLARGDLRFEPVPALAAGAGGLEAIRRIVAAAPRALREGGWLLFEHGYDQSQACKDLLVEAGFDNLLFRSDMAGLPRVAGGQLLTPKSPNR
jgi:release factor glutamine methyltransferase